MAFCILAAHALASPLRLEGLHVIDITLSRDSFQSLRAHPRRYVPATLQIDDATPVTAGIHLKGSVGSFQPIDERPSLTVDFNRFGPGNTSPTWPKIHLNNAEEDPSLVSEYVGSALFRRAGIPSPKVGHARVRLNQKNLGLFVVKEGFTPQFLERTLSPGTGALFEPEPRQDIGGSFRLQIPWKSSATKPSLHRLAQALGEPSSATAWTKIESAVDTEQFARFMAIEVLIGHRDGYTLARNNYRVYLPSPEGRVVFIPHGMDQLFQKAETPLYPNASGGLAQFFLKNTSGRATYTEALHTLAPEILAPDTLNQAVDAGFNSFKDGLSLTESINIRKRVEEFRKSALQRSHTALELLAQAPLKRVQFSTEKATVTGWKRIEKASDKVIGSSTTFQGVPSLHLVANRLAVEGFRTEVVLDPGRYRMSGKVQTREVRALSFGKTAGFVLRVEGTDNKSEGVLGTTPGWKPVAVEFEVTGNAPKRVGLRCDLRAEAGEVYVSMESLQLEGVSLQNH